MSAAVFDHRSIIATPIKANRPFSGRFEDVRLDRKLNQVSRERGAIYVDRRGRVRQDVEGQPSYIIDPVASLVFFVDPASNKLLGKVPLMPTAPESASQQACAATVSNEAEIRVRREELGQKEVEGFVCEGFRYTVQGRHESVTETWLALELEMVLLEKRWTPSEEVEHRLFQVKTSDPDPLLFVLPDRRPWWQALFPRRRRSTGTPAE